MIWGIHFIYLKIFSKIDISMFFHNYYFRCRIANCSDPILHLQKDICGLVSNDDYSHNIRVQSLPTNIIWYKYRGIKIMTSHSISPVVYRLPSSHHTNFYDKYNFDIRFANLFKVLSIDYEGNNSLWSFSNLSALCQCAMCMHWWLLQSLQKCISPLQYHKLNIHPWCPH